VLAISETTEMPTTVLKGRELPAVVPEVVGAKFLKVLYRRNDGAEPGLTGEHIIKRILEHKHVHGACKVRKLLERDLRHVRNLIHVTDHDDGAIRNGRHPTQHTLPLVFLTGPAAAVLGRLFGRDDYMCYLVNPLGVALLVILEKKLLGLTSVIDLGLHENKLINIAVKELKTEFEDIKLVIEHKPIYQHLNL
jgi:hypothetical protein